MPAITFVMLPQFAVLCSLCWKSSAELVEGLDPRLHAAVLNWRSARRLTHNSGKYYPPRHSSVHLNYISPVQGELEAWYNEVRVLSSSSVSYFAVNGHAYGYAGIQQVSEHPFKGRVLFSIWDQLCKGDSAANCPEEKRVKVTQCGESVTCTRFGGEGTGAKSQWDWDDWKVGETYGFLTVAAPRPNDRVEYTGYFHDPALNTWKVLSSMVVNRAGKAWSLHGMYSFVEQWTNSDVEDVRWARYGPALVRTSGTPARQWAPITQARWSHGTVPAEDQTHVHGNVTVSGMRWAMGLGGNLIKGTGRWATLTVTALETCPAPLIAFVSLESTNELPSADPPSPEPSTVTCGNHAASNCAQCPQGYGSSWCNGDCVWQAGKCAPKSEAPTPSPPTPAPSAVTCGGHSAVNCAGCPQDHGAAWCNGDCSWQGGSCGPKRRLAANHMLQCAAGSTSTTAVSSATTTSTAITTGAPLTTTLVPNTTIAYTVSTTVSSTTTTTTTTASSSSSTTTTGAPLTTTLVPTTTIAYTVSTTVSPSTSTTTTTTASSSSSTTNGKATAITTGAPLTTTTIPTTTIAYTAITTVSLTTTISTASSRSKVSVAFIMAGMVFANLQADQAVMDKVKIAISNGVVESLGQGYTRNEVSVTLSAGSVVATVVVTPKEGTTVAALADTMTKATATTQTKILLKVKAISGVESALSLGMKLEDLRVAVKAAVSVVEVPIVATTTTAEDKLTFTARPKSTTSAAEDKSTSNARHIFGSAFFRFLATVGAFSLM